MAEELQSLIERINRDGIEKAEAKAQEIISAAKAQAADIVKAAKLEAEKSAETAKIAAEESSERAKETIRQAARDAVVSVERSVTSLLDRLLAANVSSALADPNVAVSIAGDAVKGISGDCEIVAGPKIAESLRAQLAAKGNFRVLLDETMGAGFTVKLDGGRVEHDFTGKTIAAELAKRLRPDLAKLMSEA